MRYPHQYQEINFAQGGALILQVALQQQQRGTPIYSTDTSAAGRCASQAGPPGNRQKITQHHAVLNTLTRTLLI